MRIGLDLMGGDFAPKAALEGMLLLEGNLDENIKIVLYGNTSIVMEHYPELMTKVRDLSFIETVEAPEFIRMDESPTKAIMTKKDSSMHYGFRELKAGDIDVFISAGNTGAMLVGAMQIIKVIEGVIRPTITSLIPKENGKYGLIADVGLNPDCRQDVLFQFGLLGSLYLKHIFNIENPRVGLLNIGSEKEKGNLLAQAAFEIMDNTDKYNFIGNVEGYDIFSDKTDVIVSDGFVGNIVLKTLEGFYKLILRKGVDQEYFDVFNYENYGGTPVLGITRPVIIGHGVSSPIAFYSMIDQARSIVESNLVDEIKRSFLSHNNNL